jgi:hypothetical protein
MEENEKDKMAAFGGGHSVAWRINGKCALNVGASRRQMTISSSGGGVIVADISTLYPWRGWRATVGIHLFALAYQYRWWGAWTARREPCQ